MSIIKQGSQYTFADITASYELLPKGVYLMKQDQQGNFYLTQKEDFVMPKKIYGDHSITKRWLKSYNENSEKNMGIILSGIKGSGKTITAQQFCIQSGLPVIIINEPFSGQNFIDFLTNPKLGKCIIFIDEFEKIYPDNGRDSTNANELLSLMDGNFPTRLIFLLTVNEFRINEYLVNRLNRIKYRKHYEDLDDSVVSEVIEDLLINKAHTDSIYQFFDRINMCTFDLLVNIIKEMNLFGEDAISYGKHLNLKSENKYYEVFEIFKGKEYQCNTITVCAGETELEIERTTTNYLPEPDKDYHYIAISLIDYPLKKLSNKTFILKAKDVDGKDVEFKLKVRSFNTMVF